MLARITPIVLTLNEEANIGRCLSRLQWAKRIVVVDSLSSDGTVEIAGGFPNVSVYPRRFDGLASQWNFGVSETSIDTPWILALDADYILADEVITAIGSLDPADDVTGYRARFRYCVFGRPLRGTLYPPVQVLVRRDSVIYRQDGHAHRAATTGKVLDLDGRIDHDDRKPLGRFLSNQNAYMDQEVEKLFSTPSRELGMPDRLRKRLLAPFLVVPYTLFVKGTILDGVAGLHYTWQRAVAEMILAMKLIERRLGGTGDGT